MALVLSLASIGLLFAMDAMKRRRAPDLPAAASPRSPALREQALASPGGSVVDEQVPS